MDRRRDRQARSRGLACVWGFYGPKATGGTTTAAVNCAVDLAQLGYKVLLLDLDVLQGDCAFYLDLEKDAMRDSLARLIEEGDVSEVSLAAVTRGYSPGRGDEGRLSVIATSSFSVDLGPRCDEHLVTMMEVLQAQYDYIVIDLPSGRIVDRHVVPILDFCERVFVATNQDLASLKNVAVLLRMLTAGSFATHKVHVLLGSIVRQSHVNARDYLANLQIPLGEVVEVPLDLPSVEGAAAAAVPVMTLFPASPYAAFVHGLVNACLNRPPPEAPRLGILDRLKSLFKR